MLADMNVARWSRHLTALLLAATLPGCSARPVPPPGIAVAEASPVLRDLQSIDELAGIFDRDRDHPRVVLLLSPT